MAGFDDYESLPTHSLWIHLTAGALAGVGEHCTMYPIDLVKTRMQSLCSQCPERECRTPVSGLVSVAKREGFWRSFRGVSVIATGAVPAHALYFTVYEKLRHFLVAGTTGHHPLYTGVAGVAATLCHDAVMNPAEVVKQRMQMFCCPYSGPSDCARCVMKHEGLLAFYRSYPTQLIMNIPFHAIHFIVYEGFQSWLNPAKQYDPVSHAISGGAAGGLAAAVTTPLDVCKTVLNTQERLFVVENISSEAEVAGGITKTALTKYFSDIQNRRFSHGLLVPKASDTVRGFSHAVHSIYSARGVRGFFAGLQARVLFQMPGTAIAWSVYEFFKFLLETKKLPLADIPTTTSSGSSAVGSALTSATSPVHGHPIT